MNVLSRYALTLGLSLTTVTATAGQQNAKPGERAAAAPYAQWLVDRMVETHTLVKAVEVAVLRDGVCRTIASTAPEDVGEKCDADENEPMRTGRPDVEARSEDDPVYDVTQALHDDAGNLIGAVGMDIAPGGLDRAAVVALASRVLHEMEGRIHSQEQLLGPAPGR